MIKCEAENYKCNRHQNKIICMNEIYQSKPLLILCAAILSLLVPDIHDIKIPLALLIEDVNEDVAIDKNLQVSGTMHYCYFIPEEHFKMWKRTFLVIWVMMACLGVSVSVLLLYIFSDKQDFIVGASLSIVLAMTFLVGKTIIHQFKIFRQYKIISLQDVEWMGEK